MRSMGDESGVIVCGERDKGVPNNEEGNNRRPLTCRSLFVVSGSDGSSLTNLKTAHQRAFIVKSGKEAIRKI
jgi:hypothetical protein